MSPLAHIPEALQRASHDLDRAARDAESHFVRLGDLLVEMQARSQSLVEATRRIQRRCVAEGPLASLVERMARLAASVLGDAQALLDGLTEGLGIICAALDQAAQMDTAMRHVVLTLRMLRTLARIEDAHVAIAGLGDEFKRMSTHAEDEIVALFAHLEEARGRLGQRRHDLARHGRALRGRMDGLQARMAAHVATLRAVVDRGGSAARHLRDQEKQIEAHLGHTFTALQAHDIARQRIEHVTEAWVQLADWLLSPLPDDEALARIASTASIQWRHLAEVASQLDAALTQVSGSVDGLVGAARSQSDSALRLVGQRADGRFEVLEACREQSADLPRLFETMRGIRSEMSALDVSQVADELQGLEQSAERGRRAAEEVRRLSLNAQVRGARVEGASAAFLLAEQTRTVAEDCGHVIGQVVDALERARQAATRLLGSFAAGDARADDELRRIDDATARTLPTVTRELQEDLGALSDTRAWMEDVLAQVRGRLEAVNALGGPLERGGALMQEVLAVTGDRLPADQQAFDDMRAGYTMAGERQILDSVMGTGSASADDFDNVELF